MDNDRKNCPVCGREHASNKRVLYKRYELAELERYERELIKLYNRLDVPPPQVSWWVENSLL